MEESITYQEIIKIGEDRGEKRGERKGRLAEAREVVRYLGTERWGNPDEPILQTLNKISKLERLHELRARVSRVKSWNELLKEK